MGITAEDVRRLAAECGFELAGVTPALPLFDFERFAEWRVKGHAGDMAYLTDHRGDLRSDPRNLLPNAQSIICVGKLYNTPEQQGEDDGECGRISRYAWGADYHDVLREGLNRLAARLTELVPEPFEYRVCVDTAPLLERSYARTAGLGWIGKNTCLINQGQGSWFFLGELLISLPVPASGRAEERCGTCTRCIDACPTAALVPDPSGSWTLDARRCISYLTIENRGEIDPAIASQMGNHIFGCDICQDVCPWNRRAPSTEDERFSPGGAPRDLEELSELSAEEFRSLFRHSPISRAKYQGFLRNVAVAMGNSGREDMRSPLQTLAGHPNSVVASAAQDALRTLEKRFAALSAH